MNTKRTTNRHLIVWLITFCLMIVISPIPSISQDQTTTVQAAVKLNNKSLTLPKGSSYTLKVLGTSSTVKWYTSSSKVCTVKNGVVKAKKAGTAVITATVGRKKYSCKITVLNVKVNSNHVILSKGNTYSLKVTGASRKPTYTSSSKSIATVSKTGKITGKKKGSTKIWVKVGSKKFFVNVIVETPKLNKSSLTLYRESTYQLKLSTKRTVKWSSSNSSVAKVNSLGKITAVSSGNATIKASVGGKVYSCKVTVKTKTKITWPSTITIGLGKKATYWILVGDGLSIQPGSRYIQYDLAPADYYPGELISITITGTGVGTDTIRLSDRNGFKKTVQIKVTGTSISAGSNANTRNLVTIDSIKAYKGGTTSPWIHVNGKVTYKSKETAESLYIGYSLYNKNGGILKTFYYPILNPKQGTTYEFNHSFDGGINKWTSQVSEVKVISVQVIDSK